MPADTPQGTTIGFGTSSFTALVTGLSIGDEAREDIEDTLLSVAKGGFKTYQAADLSDPPEVTFSIQFDPDDIPPSRAAPETLTITFPLPSGGITAATLAGSGYVKSFNADLSGGADELMNGEFVWKFDGKTGPTYTAST